MQASGCEFQKPVSRKRSVASKFVQHGCIRNYIVRFPQTEASLTITLSQDLVEGGSGERKVSRYAHQENFTYGILVWSNETSTVYHKALFCNIGTPFVFQNPTLSFYRHRDHEYEEISHQERTIGARKREKKGRPTRNKRLQHF